MFRKISVFIRFHLVSELDRSQTDGITAYEIQGKVDYRITYHKFTSFVCGTYKIVCNQENYMILEDMIEK